MKQETKNTYSAPDFEYIILCEESVMDDRSIIVEKDDSGWTKWY